MWDTPNSIGVHSGDLRSYVFFFTTATVASEIWSELGMHVLIMHNNDLKPTVIEINMEI